MMQPRKTCPRCGAEMALVGPETATEGPNDAWAWETCDPGWVCPLCGLECDLGPDVEAQLEGRPRLL